MWEKILEFLRELFGNNSEPSTSPPMPNKIRLSDLDPTLVSFIQSAGGGGFQSAGFAKIANDIIIDPDNKNDYNGYTLFCYNTEGIIITLSEGLGDDFWFAIVKKGSGDINVVGNGNVTILNGASTLTRDEGTAILYANSANDFHYIGDLDTNAAPTITVSISGNPVVGETLTAGVIFNDDENDDEGQHEYEWYSMELSGGSEVPGTEEILSTTNEYTITNNEIGKRIFLDVVPRALTGNKVGSLTSAPPVDVTTDVNWFPKNDARVKLHFPANGKYYNDNAGTVLAADGQTVKKAIDEIAGTVFAIDSANSPSIKVVNGKKRLKLDNQDYLPCTDPAKFDDLVNAKNTASKWALWILFEVKSVIKENALCFKHDYAGNNGTIIYFSNRKKVVLDRSGANEFVRQNETNIAPGIYNTVIEIDLTQASEVDRASFFEGGDEEGNNSAGTSSNGSGVTSGNNIAFSVGRFNGSSDVEICEYALVENGDATLYRKLEGYGAHENDLTETLEVGHPYVTERPKI